MKFYPHFQNLYGHQTLQDADFRKYVQNANALVVTDFLIKFQWNEFHCANILKKISC